MSIVPEFHYDAIIIGSGAGGSTLAYRLAHEGLRVLLVERGGFLKPTRKSDAEPVGQYMYHITKGYDIPPSFVGGLTKFYGAALYRLRESDFREVRHEAGVSPAWPVSYTELEPYYTQAEALYRVHGSPDGDPSEPLRSQPYPHPPVPYAPLMTQVGERLRRAGSDIAPIPRGLDYGRGGKCVLCTTCDVYYCQLDAKMDAEIAALRPALATGNLHLVTETECARVLTDEAGKRVTGVLLKRGSEEQVVKAATVAVCAGIPGSALLLRCSRTDAHPQGLGNAGGALGRYMAGHSVGMIFPLISLKRLPPIHTKSFAINSYYDAAPGWPYPTGVIQTSGQLPFWEQASKVMRPVTYLVATHSLMFFYMTEALPTPETGLVFNGDAIGSRVEPVHNRQTFKKLRSLAVEAFRKAGYVSIARRRAPYLWHEVGTARMGDDPATSVVDPHCQVHDVKGLYVVDASVLPSAGAVNTGLTIIALALRAGYHIAGKAAL